MWKYEKKLQYPINIKRKDLKMAKTIITQYGGANGELAAALRYLNQRYTMPTDKGKALLTDIGTEELGHVEMISTMLYQLMKDATLETGMVIRIPLFVNEGEKVIVSTKDGKYVSRA